MPRSAALHTPEPDSLRAQRIMPLGTCTHAASYRLTCGKSMSERIEQRTSNAESSPIGARRRGVRNLATALRVLWEFGFCLLQEE